MIFIQRSRELNDALKQLPGEDPPTPFQTLCIADYAHQDPSIRPKYSDFLPSDPAVNRVVWGDCCPDVLRPNVQTDSAVDIMRKIQMRVNGGSMIVDAHAATITDQFVRSEHDHLAEPEAAGAQFLFQVADQTRGQRVIDQLERDVAVAKCADTSLPKGQRVFSLPGPRLALGQKVSLGERTARVYSPEAAVPQLRTPAGKRLETFSNLALRSADPVAVHSVVARELAVVANVELPQEYINVAKKYSGDHFVRSAAVGDRHYHAVNTHPSQACAVAVRVAPMTSSSYGKEHPVNWQSLRMGIRAIGHVNLGLDVDARIIADVAPHVLKLGYDVAKDSMAPYVICSGSISVMSGLQGMGHEDVEATGLMAKIATKRVLTAQVFAEGGMQDRLEFEQRKLEFELAEQENEETYDTLPTRIKLRIALGSQTVDARSAIIKPAFRLGGGGKAGDIADSTRSRRGPRFSMQDMKGSGATEISSLGALLRYAICIAYMQNYDDVRLRAAMFLKQCKIATVEMDQERAREHLRRDRVTSSLCVDLITAKVFGVILSLLPYCRLGSLSGLGEHLGMQDVGDHTVPKVMNVLREFLFTDRSYHVRHNLRRTIGRLVHAGMSDSGLMFSMNTCVSHGRPLHSVVLEHVKLKIDIWRQNYSAQLMLYNKKHEEGVASKGDYRQLVIWQQKLSTLSAIEFRVADKGVEVFVRDSSYAVILTNAYSARYATIARRIAPPKKGEADNRLPKWRLAEHPWGNELTPDQMHTLRLRSRDEILEFLCKLDRKYWVVDPKEMAVKLEKTMEEVVYGLRTAIEPSDAEMMTVVNEENHHYALELPADVETRLDAKFVFSLKDAPKRKDDPFQDVGKPKSTSRVPVKNARRGPSRAGLALAMGGPMRFGAGGKKSYTGGPRMMPPSMASPFGTVPKLLRMSAILDAQEGEHELTELERMRILEMLSVGCPVAVTEESSSAVLKSKWHCNAEDRRKVRAEILAYYESHMQAKLTAAKMVDPDDLA